jgi:integrase
MSPKQRPGARDHLWQRGHQYYLKLGIPRPLRTVEHFPGKAGKARDTILEPLGNHYDAAKVECARRVAAYLAVFKRLKDGEKMTPDQIKAAVTLDVAHEAQRLRNEMVAKILRPRKNLLDQDVPIDITAQDILNWQARERDEASRDFIIEAEIADIARRKGLTIKPFSALWNTLYDAFRHERVAALDDVLEHLRSSAPKTERPAPMMTAAPAPVEPVATETIREALDAWLANPRLGGGKPQSRLTTQGHRTRVELFIKAVGNVPLSSIERPVAANYIASLKGRTRTRNNHRMSLWMMYRNAGLRGRFSRNSADNPFDGLHQSLTKEERKKHISPFRVPEIQEWLDSFRFEIAPKKRNPQTALPWASLVALYSGMRREEISQLVVSDIKECTANGGTIVTMRAHDEGSNNIKTEVPRLVPVHSALVRAGFLDYVAASPKDGPLFPGLQPRPSKDGRLSCRIGELFSKRLRSLGIQQRAAAEQPTRQLCFHSLKHNVGQALDTAKESKEDIARVLGHAVEGISLETYSHEGPGLARVKAVIEAIQFPGLRLPTAV